jgi:phosphohistidine swiveling domain-containing protein
MKGEILLAKCASGIILKVGGMMTHGAIIARECGVLTVVGVENATTILYTGDYVHINADKGYVEIIKEV